MSNIKILINASNLHTGGGVQVASSFINEVSQLITTHEKYLFLCSSEVYENLSQDAINSLNIIVYDLYGFESFKPHILEQIEEYRVCFTIFGPFYGFKKFDRHIVGFANPWLADFKNAVILEKNIFSRIKIWSRLFIRWLYFSRCDEFIVEQVHVKNKLLRLPIIRRKNIHVVSNTISKIFFNKKNWKPVNFNLNSDVPKIGYLGRNYEHKNLKILLDVDIILKRRNNLKLDFVFTLDDIEFKELGFSERENFHTVGPLKVSQCPSFYEQIDATVFPSRLECFSATPIESIFMGVPVFCSRKDFITDLFNDSLIYFDECDANSIADAILSELKGANSFSINIEEAKSIVKNLSTAKERAEKYLKIIG